MSDPKVGMGTSLAQNGFEWSYVDQRFGGTIPVRRSFDGELHSSWSSCNAAADIPDGRKTSIYSMRTEDWQRGAQGAFDSTIRSFLRGVPTNHDLRFSVNHEPEDDLNSSNRTPAQWQGWHRRVSNIVKEVNQDRNQPIKFGAILMAFTHQKSDRAKYIPNDAESVWDFMAFDGYSWPQESLRSVETIFDGDVEWVNSISRKIHIGISEMGCSKEHPRRRQWILDGRAWAASVDIRWMCYWNNQQHILTRDGEYAALRPETPYP